VCPFCAIADGTEPAHIVAADNASVAFLDRRPLFAGHVLLIPREHYVTLTDLPAASVGPLFSTARLLSAVVEEALEADGTFVACNNRVSQSVAHFHVHIVPRRRKDGLRGFFWPRHRYADESEMEVVAASIRTTLERRREGLLR
jgi:histidine triad (HIT) family protein